MEFNFQKWALLLTVLASSIIMTGCGISLQKYEVMPAQTAWKEMRKDSQIYDSAGILGSGYSVAKNIAAKLAEKLDEAIANAEQGASDPSIPLAGLDRAADRLAQKLIVELAHRPEFKDKEWQLSLVIGTPNTGRPNQVELEMMLDSLRSKLMENETFNARVRVLTSRWSDRQKIVDKYSDIKQYDFSGREDASLEMPHPDDLYILTTSLKTLDQSKKAKDEYVLRVQVDSELFKPKQGKAIFMYSDQADYRFHPAHGEYISPERDAELFKSYYRSKGKK